MTKAHAQRFVRVIPVLLLLIVPLRLAGQSAQQAAAGEQLERLGGRGPQAGQLRAAAEGDRRRGAGAATPERHVDNLSPDRKWFLDEIGDGPVLMKTFSKPFHELGGVFIDYKANRARALTIRNNVGIQIISAADGAKKPIQTPAGDARLERRLVARQRERRLSRARRRRDARVGRGCRDRKVETADEDAAPGHARHELRVHR